MSIQYRGGEAGVMNGIDLSKAILLLPAHNEAEAIADVIDEIKRVRMPDGIEFEIMVIDSGCTDRTAEIALEKEARVFSADRGKGRAVRRALKTLDNNYDYILIMDSDYTYSPRELPVLLEALAVGHEVAMTYRAKGLMEKEAMTQINRFGNRALTSLANFLYGTNINDVCTGMWGFQAEVAKNLPLKSDGFTLEADLFVNVAHRAWDIVEVPVAYRKRRGNTKLIVSDGLKIGWFLVRRSGLRGWLKLLGVIVVVAGLVYIAISAFS